MELKSTNISRRELLAKGAVAGGILWAAPVIESVTSMAAAQSTTCIGGTVAFTDSFIYVVFSYNGVIYFSGFSQGDTKGMCTDAGKPLGSVCFTCGGVEYTFTSGTPTVTYGAPYSSPPGVCGTPTTKQTSAVLVTTTSNPPCGTYLSINGGTVSPAESGVTILAGFCFGSNNTYPFCPDASGCVYATSCG
jgi:hypothetical protein